MGEVRLGADVDEVLPFVTTVVFTEVVEGADVSCSCVGDPRVLGTRERRGVRLPTMGVVEVMGVELPPPVITGEVVVVVVVVERGRREEEEKGCGDGWWITRGVGTLSYPGLELNKINKQTHKGEGMPTTL